MIIMWIKASYTTHTYIDNTVYLQYSKSNLFFLAALVLG